MLILHILLQVAAIPQNGTQAAAGPQRGVADPGVIATNQRITPAGAETVFQGRVTGLRFARNSSEIIVAVGSDIYRMAWADNRVAAHWKVSGRTGIYGIAPDTAANRFLLSSVGRVPAGAHLLPGTAANSGSIAQLTAIDADGLHPFGGFGHDMAGSPAVAAHAGAGGVRVAVLPLTADDQLAEVNAESGALIRTIALGVVPLGAVIADDGAVAWVTELAGKQPQGTELSAKQCCEARAEAVRIDPRGIAMAGTVARVDLRTGEVSSRITVGRHPTDIVWDQRRNRIYVTDGNSDEVSVIDSRGDSLVGSIVVAPFRARAAGLAPTALALSPDGSMLYVALGGVNAVAIYDVAAGPHAATLRGMIPTAWYPSTLDVSGDGRFLAIGTLLGVGSGTGANVGMTGRYVHAVRGAVNVLPVPARGQLAAFTVAVSQNNRLPLASGAGAAAVRADVAARAVPERPGEPSLIHHVVYIIRENRTYDQILGDLPRGDNDSQFVMYGRSVTPNAHALSEQFVTLDRFFAEGGNSADGHQWLTQANETEYVLWPLYEGRSYPYDGSDPLAYSSGGFIWDDAISKGKSVEVFGEFAPEPRDQSAGPVRSALLAQYRAGGDVRLDPPYHTTSPIPSLDHILVRDFPSWTLAVPDVVRAQMFKRSLARWEAGDSMPNLVMLQLPSDHTAGTGAGDCTPKACVADNDLAVGQVVDALSHSTFWKDMAIFVVEDDAQNGVDHVDGHRTVALAISPYTRRGAVDSTFYNHPSLLKTIELMLGLPALSIFDLAATDLGNAFITPKEKPDLRPYTAIEPAQSIYEVNPAPARLHGAQRQAALASAKMRFDIPDAAPTEKLNRILWQDARGWGMKYPATRASLFFPMTVDIPDTDRDGDDH